MKIEIKKLSALILAVCLILSVFTATSIGALTSGNSKGGEVEELELGVNYFKASPDEYERQYSFDYKRDNGVYHYTPAEDCVLDAVVIDKNEFEPDSFCRFTISGKDGFSAELPAYVKKGETYTLENSFFGMSCLFSYRTCEEIKPGETKDVVIGENESYYFIPDSDMTLTYSSNFKPAEDETEDASASALIKEDNRELAGIQSTKPDLNNFSYNFYATAGHVYVFKNYQLWKAYQRTFGSFSVSLENKPGFELKDGTAVKYMGSDAAVKVPMYYGDQNKVKKIGSGCFEDNSTLEKVSVPRTVEEIGENAFKNCQKLAMVELSEGLKKIGDGAFLDCPSLLSVDIPDSVEKIGAKAFGYLSDGTKIEGFTVRGLKDSSAQKYAEANGFEYVRLDEKIEITLPSRTPAKRINNGESSTFVYKSHRNGEVTFIDSNDWNEAEIPLTSAEAVDSNGNVVAHLDDFSHSVIGMPFTVKEGETYTITVNAIDRLEPVSEDDEYFWYYKWIYYELREVVNMKLDHRYTCFSEYPADEYDEYGFVDETKFFRFTAPADGILKAVDSATRIIEDGGYYYFNISDSERLSENTLLKTEVKKGHTYYIKSNYQMCTTTDLRFILTDKNGNDIVVDQPTPDSAENTGGNTTSDSPSSNGSGFVGTGECVSVFIVCIILLAAAGVVIFYVRRRES